MKRKNETLVIQQLMIQILIPKLAKSFTEQKRKWYIMKLLKR